MTHPNPAGELRLLRAQVDWLKRDAEERTAYFQRDRELLEKRIAALSGEVDHLRQALEDAQAEVGRLREKLNRYGQRKASAPRAETLDALQRVADQLIARE